MKNYNQVMVTMLGLLIVAFFLTDYANVMYAMMNIHRSGLFEFYIPLSALYFGPLIWGFYLLIRPDSLSKIFKMSSDDDSSEISLKKMFSTVLVIMGLFIALYAFTYLVEEGIRISLYYLDSEPGVEQRISVETKAKLLSYVFEVILGLIMALKATQLTTYFIKE